MRGSSTSPKRGVFGSPVSSCAKSTKVSLSDWIRSAKVSRNAAIFSGDIDRNSLKQLDATSRASSISFHSLTGKSRSSASPVDGFEARNEEAATESRKMPLMYTFSMVRSSKYECLLSLNDCICQGANSVDRNMNYVSFGQGERSIGNDARSGQ